MHWARFYLAKAGYIGASQHGVWTLITLIFLFMTRLLFIGPIVVRIISVFLVQPTP